MFGRLAGCLKLHLLNLLLSKSLIAEHRSLVFGGYWHHCRLRDHALVDHGHHLLLRDVAGQCVLHFEETRVKLVIFFGSLRHHLCCLDVFLLLFFPLEKVILALISIYALASGGAKGVVAKRNLSLDGVHDLRVGRQARLDRNRLSVVLSSVVQLVLVELLFT